MISRVHEQTEECVRPDVLCRYESDRKQERKTEEGEEEEAEGEGEGRKRLRSNGSKRTRQNKDKKKRNVKDTTSRTQMEDERRVVTQLDYRTDSDTSALSDVLQSSFSPEKPTTGYPPKKRKRIEVEGSEPAHCTTETTTQFEAEVTMETEHVKKRRTSNGLAGLVKDQERLSEARKERSRSTTPGNSLPSGSRRKSPANPIGQRNSENRAQELGRRPRTRSGSSLSERHTPALSSTEQPAVSRKARDSNKNSCKGETAPTGEGRDETASLPARAAEGELTAATTVSEMDTLSDSDSNSNLGNYSHAISDSEDDLPPVDLGVNESVNSELMRIW